MPSSLRLLCTLLLALLASGTADAQFSRARNPMDQVGRLESTLRGLDRTPLDERALAAAAKELRDACLAASEALSGLGDPLAAAAVAPHEERFRELARLTKNLAYETGKSSSILEAYDRLTRLLETRVDSRGSDFEQQVKTPILTLVINAGARSKDFQTLSQKVEET